ncbi:MAG: bifunctional hydroxymethylpyrimidine kinase/phosphomethylpyrimidine kinase [Verrucomicrobia bacterium]|nr:bifunctional hydroxymethylpyrimidine kinase/phosphomethylpyrimidine kinase [Verrucomicrobiota bacterium]MBV8279700.1 bifunctional hydroxymethylpyrimidine kinase/phosphomethylpyrimidine kinase [Verrucomicrobiota bacterium]
MEPPPVTITIAGSDSSAGAGIQADLKTFTYFRVFGQSVVTCVVAEVPGKVQKVQAVDVDTVREQLSLSLEYFPVRAIKMGMLYSKEIIGAVCDILESIPLDKRPSMVVDPVMIASSGDRLLEADALGSYLDRLFPLATVVTPNRHETAIIYGQTIGTAAELEKIGPELVRRYGTAFLLKGGHWPGDLAIDYLATQDGIWSLSEPFVPAKSTHGTGCTLSAALAAGLALGDDLQAAARRAKAFVTRAIAESMTWSGEHGPVSALKHW